MNYEDRPWIMQGNAKRKIQRERYYAMTPDERKQRTKDIYSDRKSGMTLEKVATKYGLTRERIRQIVAKVNRVKAREVK